MKFTYYDQTVDLFAEEYFPNGPPDRIVINCSGGLDSSLVVALMSKLVKPKTFSIGFEDHEYDESQHAKKIANYLHTEHNELVVTEKDAPTKAKRRVPPIVRTRYSVNKKAKHRIERLLSKNDK